MSGRQDRLTPTQARSRKLRRERRGRVVRHAILLAWTAIIVFPIFWMVSTSFKDAGEWVTWPPHWLPARADAAQLRADLRLRRDRRTLSRQATEQAFTHLEGTWRRGAGVHDRLACSRCCSAPSSPIRSRASMSAANTSGTRS